MANVRTILYCEDDPVVRRVYKRRLEHAGFHILYAEDGLEALKYLHQFVPDLVVLDLMMPKFSGEEVLKFICNDSRLHEIPLIILSTNSEVEDGYQQISGRADKYLIKYNCTPDKLLETIQEVFAGPPQENPGDTMEDSDSMMFEKIQRLIGGSSSQ
jgi:two-component system, OmpR family, phosphate regulon response regulator PhoB